MAAGPRLIEVRRLPLRAGRAPLSVLLVVLSLHLWIAGCAAPPASPSPERLGTWVVYWDADRGLAELARHGELFDYASLFAYELDSRGRPVPAPGLESLARRFRAVADKHGVQAWATVVNDVRHADGTVSLKSPGVVHAILEDPGRRAAHARSLAERISRDGFRGLHLDYERVDRRYTEAFRKFVALLESELTSRGRGLNIILEPERGPRPAPGAAEVTVMAYNQHGPHSGPGPRATPAFVRGAAPGGDLDRRAAPSVALGLSGFLWKDDGAVESVDWAGAQDAVRSTVPERGLFTRVPYARVPSGELWFEDAESLDVKWRAAHAAGFRGLALWRLGGNDERLFNWLENLTRDKSRAVPANR